MKRPDDITEDDWTDLRYFWTQKGDLARCTSFVEISSRIALCLEGRMILQAWDEKVKAERMLELLLGDSD